MSSKTNVNNVLLSNIHYFPELYYSSVLNFKKLPFITKKKRQLSISGLNMVTGHIFCNPVRKPLNTTLFKKSENAYINVRILKEETYLEHLDGIHPFFYNYVNYIHFFKQFTLCYILYYIFKGFLVGSFSNFFAFSLKFDNFKIPLTKFLKKMNTTKKNRYINKRASSRI